MAPSQCCVNGCTATSETHKLFRFPRNEYWRRLWITILTPHNPILTKLSPEQLKSKRVCEQHFDENQLTWHGRRCRYSYPTLFIVKDKECNTTPKDEDNPEQNDDGPEETIRDSVYNLFYEQDYCFKVNESSNRQSSLSVFSNESNCPLTYIIDAETLISDESNFSDLFEGATCNASCNNDGIEETVLQIDARKVEDIVSETGDREDIVKESPTAPALGTPLDAAMKSKCALKKSLAKQMLSIVSENLSDSVLLKLEQVQAVITKKELMLRFQQCFEQAYRDFIEYADYAIQAKETCGTVKSNLNGTKRKKCRTTASHENITSRVSPSRSPISLKARKSRKKNKSHGRKNYRSASDMKKKRRISSEPFSVRKKADSAAAGRKLSPTRSASPRNRSKSPGKRSSASVKWRAVKKS